MKGTRGNKRIEDFRVVQQLGEGGYGVVYLVQNRQTEELFALK